VRLAAQSSPGSDEPEINLISLIDVMFCLILFLVMTTTFTQRSVLKLQLPEAQSDAKADPGNALVIAIDAEGKNFIGNNQVQKTDLESVKDAIVRAVGEERTQPVVLRADGRTPHQAVVTAMDALGQLGFTRLSIATAPEKRP